MKSFKLGIEGICFNIIHTTYKKHQANIIHRTEKPIFPCKIGNKTRMPRSVLTNSIECSFQTLVGAIRLCGNILHSTENQEKYIFPHVSLVGLKAWESWRGLESIIRCHRL